MRLSCLRAVMLASSFIAMPALAAPPTTSATVPSLSETNGTAKTTITCLTGTTLAAPQMSVGPVTSGADETSQVTVTCQTKAPPSVIVSGGVVKEGARLALTATRTGDLRKSSRVTIATQDWTALAGADYTAKTMDFYFAAGVATATVTMTTLQDTLVEGPEKFLGNLTVRQNAVLTNSRVEFTIQDDDVLARVPKLATINQTVSEAKTDVYVTVTKDLDNGLPLTYAWSQVGGTALVNQDYSPRSETRTIPAGILTDTFVTNLVNDAIHEDQEAFQVKIQCVTNCDPAPALGTITINDDDPVIVPPIIVPPIVIPPATGWMPSPTIDGMVSIPSPFDPLTYLTPSWGSGNVAPTASPDVVGAFRFTLGDLGLNYDDPVMYPNQPGASHLHQWYGNRLDANMSTYDKVRGAYATATNPVNPTGYWSSALLDGNGNVIRPDYESVYYKRRPASDPACQGFGLATQGQGTCLANGIPNGLKMIFGYDMINGRPAETDLALYFNCDGPGAVQGHYKTMAEAIPNCPATRPENMGDANKRNRFGVVMNARTCWDAKNLDSPDHRSHVAYKQDTHNGYAACPATHPYVMPDLQLAIWYTILPGDDLRKWSASSDPAHPEAGPLRTFHADYDESWDGIVKQMWVDNCINKKLNCAGGDLGNGKQIKQYANPVYGFVNPNPRTPIPPAPMTGMTH